MTLLAILGIVAFLIYFLYARLIRLKNNALEALSSIDVQLKKRRDLIPNIVKIAKKFMDHEAAILSKVTQMRSIAGSDYDRNNPEEVAQYIVANKGLQSAAMNLFAVAENYPDLKSSDAMIRSQEAFEEVEGHISASRRYYNSAVTDLKNAVEILPGSIIASMLAIKAMPYFEADEDDKKPVDVLDYL